MKLPILSFRFLAATLLLCGIPTTALRAGEVESAKAHPATTRSSAPDDAFTDTDAFVDGATTGPHPHAGDESPELMLFKDMPVVVAAAMRQQTQQQAAASVTVVDADTIQLFGYRSLADVLRDQRSFYLHTDGLNWFAGARGFLRPGEWNARLLVLVDGRPTREMIYGQTHLDEDFVVPMEAVKQIEIVRGPGSALYGSNAVFGVVNVVTKSGAEVNGTEVRVQGGTLATGRVSALWGAKLPDDWDVLANFTAFGTNGNHDIKYDAVNDADHNFGFIRGHDAEDAYSGFIKVRKGEFTAEFDAAARDKGNRAATYLVSFLDPGTMFEKRANATFRFDHEIGDGQSLHAMVHYGHYKYDQTYGIDAADATPAYKYTTTAEDAWLEEEVHYDWQATKRFHLLVGAEGSQTLYAHQIDRDTLHGEVLNVSSSLNSWALFGEGEFQVTDWLSVIGGGRLDDVQRIGVNVSPRLAAIVTPTKQDTVKALYGRAFRQPNLYEQFYASPGANAPNPGLKPEVVDTFELAWERQNKHGWRTSLNGYLWKMSDSMENFQVPSGAVQTRNSGTIWAHGVEAEVDKRWESGASLRAYATYTRTEKDDQSLTHSPVYIVGGAVAFPVIGKNTFLAVEPQIVGSMKTDLGDYTHPTFITNIVLTSREVTPGLTLQAGVYNLFARSARLPRGGPFNQFEPTLNYPGTLLLVGATYRF